jgi:hypothetical protein
MIKSPLNLVTALVMASASLAGCTVSEQPAPEGQSADQLSIGPRNTAFVLTVVTETNNQNAVSVTSTDGSPVRRCVGGCEFAYLTGSTLTLQVLHPTDIDNCFQFTGWTGVCAPAGTGVCSLVLNSDQLVSAIWSDISGCKPK